jgi:hypothetical protein
MPESPLPFSSVITPSGSFLLCSLVAQTAGSAVCGFSKTWDEPRTAKAAVRAKKLGEQSQNVYENKGSAEKSTAPCPSLTKEGNPKLPSSGEEGREWCGFVAFERFAPWREIGVRMLKIEGTKPECI